MYDHPGAGIYRNSLAQPDCGTLEKRRRFQESTYEGRVFAKTGYISGVRALSGYCQRRDGKWLAFAILTNTPPASNDVIDKIVKLVIN
jgi:D-alanyl-D-alanine carboxypeptidase/D-alanyl-D-alanine-endopeptidase (penicillin-binding protein 4)